MARVRISDMATGPLPIANTSLLEMSVANPGSATGTGYDTYRYSFSNLTAAMSSSYLPIAGGVVTGNLGINGSVQQGGANPNSGYQGIASISNSYNEIAVYGGGTAAGTDSPYCAISADSGYGYVYATKLPLGVQSDQFISFWTGGPPNVERMRIAADGSVYLFYNLHVDGGSVLMSISLGSDFANRKGWFDGSSGYGHLDGNLSLGVGSNYLSLYDDGNSHVESEEQLWLNGNGKPTAVGGNLTVGGSGYIGNTLEVGSWLQVDGGRIVSKGDNNPSLSMWNGAGGYACGFHVGSRALAVGSKDGTGNPNGDWGYWSLDTGQLLLSYPATVSWGGSGIALTVHTGGPDASINYDNSSGIYWVVGNISGNFDWWVNQPGGAATLGRVTNVGVWQNMGGSWNVLSSASLKQDIAPWRPENALEAIKHLNPVKFRYRAGTPFAPRDAPSAEVLGLIAEDVAPDFPEIVGTTTVRMQDDDVEVDTLAPGLLVYPLVLAVQQLADMVEDMQRRLNEKE